MVTPKILIVGAGLGGLCLAAGLRRAGMRVRVFERDPDPGSRGQGYRLHIDERGAAALRSCLPPAGYETFLATSGGPSTRLTVMTRRMRPVATMGTAAASPGAVNTCVDRATLREILLREVGGDLRFDAIFARYSLPAGGGVTAHFTDGTAVTGTLLVGADGAGSAVRRQLLPHAEVTDTGERCVFGRTPLALIADAAPEQARHGFVAVAGARGLGMALGQVAFREPPRTYGLTPREPYLMWALSGARDRFGDPDLETRDGTQLRALAARLTARWHPRLRALIAHADPASCVAVPVRVARPVPPWPAGPVTLLGDAIHAMSPARGSGANIALKDAGLLAAALATGVPPVEAVAGYEEQMREYGFAAALAASVVPRPRPTPLRWLSRPARGR